jgi:hypothetical protein
MDKLKVLFTLQWTTCRHNRTVLSLRNQRKFISYINRINLTNSLIVCAVGRPDILKQVPQFRYSAAYTLLTNGSNTIHNADISATLEWQNFARGFPMTAFPLAGSSSSCFCGRFIKPCFFINHFFSLYLHQHQECALKTYGIPASTQ